MADFLDEINLTDSSDGIHTSDIQRGDEIRLRYYCRGRDTNYLHKKRSNTIVKDLFCGDSRSRTDDPLLAKQML